MSGHFLLIEELVGRQPRWVEDCILEPVAAANLGAVIISNGWATR